MRADGTGRDRAYALSATSESTRTAYTFDRLGLPFMSSSPCASTAIRREAAPRVLVDQDRPAEDLRVRLEASGDVDGVADARVGRAVLRAGVARDDAARRDADADLDLHLAAAPPAPR